MLFSQDDDLLREATLRQREGGYFAGLIYGHQRHITIGRCVDDMQLIPLASEAEDD